MGDAEFGIESEEAFIAAAQVSCSNCREKIEVICIHCYSGHPDPTAPIPHSPAHPTRYGGIAIGKRRPLTGEAPMPYWRHSAETPSWNQNQPPSLLRST